MPLRVHCLSDTHGFYQDLQLPACDLLVISGDVLKTKLGPGARVDDAHMQYQECAEHFYPWLSKQSFDHCVFIWGNHDFIGEQYDFSQETLPDRVHFLQDSLITLVIKGQTLRIFGTPWTPWFFDWAFNAPEDENFLSAEPFLTSKWDLCPNDVDVLLCHGPPRGFGDKTTSGDIAGSFAFKRAIERIKPKLCVFGHIHEQAGQYQHAGATLINASVLDRRYHIQNHGVSVMI
jgi:Icc-related predicted phosphoesterase